MLLPDVPGEVFTTADALRRGVTQRQLEWAVRSGRLHRLQPGVFCPATTWARAEATERAVLAARAAALVRRSAEQYALSHLSAAALLGLPVPESLADHVWLTVPPGGHTRRSGTMVRQVAPLPDGDVVLVDGVPCTSAARTVADCLRHLPPPEAVALADAALHAGFVTVEQITTVLMDRRWPRSAAAARLVPLLDGRRESGLESRSAVIMDQYGLPRPRSQVRITDQAGRVVARVDFAWEEHGVVGEADGLVKYGDGSGRAVADEKRREAKLQALGLVVARWTGRHLHGEPPLLVDQLSTALAQGDPRTFRGRMI